MNKIITKVGKKQLQIEIASALWGKVRGLEARLRQAAAVTLAHLPASLAKAAAAGQMTVLLTSDKAVQTLNRDFRGKDKPTNVLSFPSYEKPDLVCAARLGAPLYVGDIAIAYAFTAKEAKVEGKILLDHVTHLTIHGILHLYGYDHDTPARAGAMERLEKHIMAALGLSDPYAPLPKAPAKRARRAR